MQRYLKKEDVRRFLDCPRKGWYGLRGNKSKLDQDPFLAFLGEEARAVRRIARRLFRESVDWDDIGGQEGLSELLSSTDDFTLFEPELKSRGFFARPSFLIRRGGKAFLVNVSAKAGDLDAHGDGKMLVTYYGNVRSEWKEHLLGLAFDCEIARSLMPGAEIRPYLLLPAKGQSIGEDEAGMAENSPGFDTSVESEEAIALRRRRSILRFFEASKGVDLLKQSVAVEMENLSKAVEVNEEPEPTLRYACRNCEYRTGGVDGGFSRCWGDLAKPKPHLFDLHQLYSLKNGRGLLADRKIQDGKTGLLDVDDSELHGEHRKRQAMQLDCVRSGTEFIDPALGAVIGVLDWPIRFVDFETSMAAVPWLIGTRPYELQAFQWSLHTLHEDGSLLHDEWLHDGIGDPSREFISTLSRALGETGSVLIYTDYEIQVLNTVRERFLRNLDERDVNDDWISAFLCSGRLLDQHDWVLKYYCHPSMGGRTSLKKALPAAWSESKALGDDARFIDYVKRGSGGDLIDPYETLPSGRVLGKSIDVREGCGAMKAYRELAVGAGRSDPLAASQLKELLLAYCKLDTAAQVVLFEHWRRRLSLLETSKTKKMKCLASQCLSVSKQKNEQRKLNSNCL